MTAPLDKTLRELQNKQTKQKQKQTCFSTFLYPEDGSIACGFQTCYFLPSDNF